MKLRVFKFGGSSVKDAQSIKRVESIIKKYSKDKLVIVISAMGKSTNALEEIYNSFIGNGKDRIKLFDNIIDKHLEVAEELDCKQVKLKSSFNAFIKKATEKATSNKGNLDLVYDQLISLGELFSTKLISRYFEKAGLNNNWLDVRKVLLTNEDYKDAKVDFLRSKSRVEKHLKSIVKVGCPVITQGFIGSTKGGFTTTLGREGSDYTAALLAYLLEIDELTIWKDVPGIMTGDPRLFNNVELLERISYREAIEMTYYGAKVIHPKTIQPIQNKGIKLNVRSFFKPKSKGTVISDKGMLHYPPVVVIQEKVILLEILRTDFSFIAEDHLSLIFALMDRFHLKLNIMRNSAVSFTLCISNTALVKLNNFVEALGPDFTVEYRTDLELITVRHFQDNLITSLIKNKTVLFEERLKDTLQLVVKPAIKFKSED